MPFIAVCPFCHKGKVRAPDHAVGLSATCPKCYSCFTLAPASELPTGSSPRLVRPTEPVAAAPAAPAAPVRTAAAVVARPVAPEPSAVETGPEHEKITVPEIPVPASVIVVERPAVPEAPPPVVVRPPSYRPRGKAISPVALLSLTAAGLSLSVTQVPYGAFAAVFGGLCGLGLGLCGVATVRGSAWLEKVSCGVNVLVLLVLGAFPGWLGLPPWWSSAPDNLPMVMAIPFDGGAPYQTKWVDASAAAWQFDDVRIAIRFVHDGPVELTGPKKKKQLTKDKCLYLWVHVTNAGVSRTLDFQGWKNRLGMGADGPHLSDSSGRMIAPKRFEVGWDPPGQPERTTLPPGRSADQMLAFESPADLASVLRLELPGNAYGGKEIARFEIPRSSIIPKPAP